MAQRDDQSLSPRTRSPRAELPILSSADHGNGTASARLPGLRSQLSVGDLSQKSRDLAHRPTAPNDNPYGLGLEATDYINGGVPHEGVSPATSPLSNGSAAPQSRSVLKQPSTAFAPESTAAGDGTSTPPTRRSVQFARHDPGAEYSNNTRVDSFETDGDMSTIKDRRGNSLMSRLKTLASSGALQTHGRTYSNTASSFDEGTQSAPMSPTAGGPTRLPHALQEEGSDIDGDAEDTADEGTAEDSARTRRKRRFRRPRESGNQTAPTTPRARAILQTESPSGASRGIPFLGRRATDGSLDQRGHLSEGEGRDRLNQQSAWRRGGHWARNLSYGGNAQGGEVDGTPGAKRPSNFRRMTGIGGGHSEGEGAAPKRPFMGAERATTFGAQRWRMIKHGFKMLAQKKDPEHRVDYLKSAELMAELRAGAPAALMLASMIQRDEHGNKRIPVLLEQLKLGVTDSKPSIDVDPDDSERHLVFRIELEYGSGMNRMKWVIQRSIKDFYNLHLRYKLQGGSDKYLLSRGDNDARPKQPKFPYSAFPYFRGLRGLGESDSEPENEVRAGEIAGDATQSEGERRKKKMKRRPSFGTSRRKSSIAGQDPHTGAIVGGGQAAQQSKIYNERQRKRLEQYLQEMIRWLIFRADSNRLCRFLELSALGVRLAAEGSYHGKEGNLLIQSGSSIDVRRFLTPKLVFARLSSKWFLVRHSYIVCVDSPENMHIYDVYLADPQFEIKRKHRKITEMGGREIVARTKSSAAHPQHHSLKLQNSERKLKLLAKNERLIRQFDESITYMLDNTLWSKPNRFGSFAPVRTGVYAQWLVDGRDYMWNVSRAINMAKDVIYIHDWWLSPQLYMRRPAAISQKWRLDRLLQKKAREGVKVFIIIYRNVEAAIPIDSEFTKFSMLDLHPNIFVQRSPNQYKKNQFFFAHHEKICIVDHTVAFVGGIDLCFGRWDTPQHSVCDDKATGFEQTDGKPKDADHCQLWPGKDYSNPRVQDFYNLNEPYAEMYDRSKVPRMPWHDISMQVIGQPARDLTRHFVQRWNYVLRGRKPTRPTPFLLPPPDYNAADLEALGLTGTCEVQILRSASNWSLGVTDVEHSIMNAYCKMIEESDHFVYMENQFFITSCETMNVKIVNKIGDAIVERAVRAHENGETWRCCILIPLMPGFQNTVEEPEGTSVRLIMQCQFRSICRGDNSIFGRLRKLGIEPEDYVQFYSLRSWGKIGPQKTLVTEQLYIHAKVIIVDDRIALVGSANINERSMLGSRDSETAAVVRDTDMIWSTMDGKPYLVGRFAHTLRMRLMREHLGLDVDEEMDEECRAEADREETEYQTEMEGIYGDENDRSRELTGSTLLPNQGDRIASASYPSFNHDASAMEADNPNIAADRFKPVTTDKRIMGNVKHAADVDGAGMDQMMAADQRGISRGRDSVLLGEREVLVADVASEGKGTISNPQKPHARSPFSPYHNTDEDGQGNDDLPPLPRLPRRTTEQLGLTQLSQLPSLPILDDTDIGGPPVYLDQSGAPISKSTNPNVTKIKPAPVSQDCMRDPLNETFFEETWRHIAENNTEIFRQVFRCNPDSAVTNWHEYSEYVAYADRFAQAQGGDKSTEREAEDAPGQSGPPGAGLVSAGTGVISAVAQAVENMTEKSGNTTSTARDRASNNPEEHSHIRLDTSAITDSDTNGALDGFDEKAALRNISNEAPSPVQPTGNETFPSLDDSLLSPTDASPEKFNGARKTTFSTTNTGRRRDVSTSTANGSATQGGSFKKRRRATTKSSRKGFSGSDDLLSPSDVEELLSMIQGHLVVFPYDWLHKEELNNNWLYQVDMVAPLQIYN